MKTSSTMVFLGMSALTGVLVLGSSIQGCRSDSGGFGGSTSTTSSTSSGTGPGGSTSDSGVPTVTIEQITNTMATGHVGKATPVQIVGAVAMSTKFLVTHSKSSNSCLWGVFLSDPKVTETAPYSGILAVSYGTQATAVDGGTAYCPVFQAGMPAGDHFPDDIKPGDVVTIEGKTDSYIPSTCTAADAGVGFSMVPGYQISSVMSVTRTGTAPVPTAHKLTSSDLATLASGSDPDWLAKWGNVYIEADGVTAESQAGLLTDTYGHMLLNVGTNGIQVGDKLYYVGYVKDTDACYSGPVFANPPPITFNFIKGFVYLDYCNWSIAPGNKCFDLSPPSADCASVALDGGTPDSGSDGGEEGGADGGSVVDAGPNGALVCLH